MKTIFTIVICGLFISFFISCKKENEDTTPAPTGISISGKAQKGPFKEGSDVVINEVDSKLEQTGKSSSTTVTDNEGSFSFTNFNLTTGYASLTATGYYHMEPFNLDATYRIYLEAVGDVQNGSTINVNLLTHLIKPRMEKLAADGSTFTSARTQAQNELKAFLHVPSPDSTNFEDMTVSANNFLFATSLLFQRRHFMYEVTYNYVNELTHLLNSFRSDFRDNGQIDSPDIIDTLIYNANRIQLIDDKVNLENYISSLGGTTSLAGYEEYIYAFQKAWSSNVYVNYVYPDSINFIREFASDIHCRNILFDTAVHFQGGGEVYSLSAIVPCDSSLQIKFTRLSPDSNAQSFSMNNLCYGWLVTPFLNGFTIEAQRKNYPNALLLWLWSSPADSARVEYFRNHEPVPYLTKKIYWYM